MQRPSWATSGSSEEQATSGLGLADQRQVIESEARRRGWEDIQFMSDEGYGAKTLGRPAVSEALALLASGQASTLVVSKLDRLSRSLIDFASLLERASKEGWQLVVLDLNVDTTTPSGQLVAHVMGAFAQDERQLIAARTCAALQQLKARGVRLGRPRTLPPEVTARIVNEREEGSVAACHRRPPDARRHSDCPRCGHMASSHRRRSHQVCCTGCRG